VAGYTILAALFFAPALATPRHQVATDLLHWFRPWNELLEEAPPPRNQLLSDPPLQMLPFRELVRERLLAGEMPLWAHELGTGQPLLANAQSAPFAPLHLMALPLPTLRALTVAVAWQVLLGLLLMHALVRRLGGSPAGAVLAAVAYAFSTFSIAWAYYPMGMSAMWIPGLLLGLLRTGDGSTRGPWGLGACGLGLALSGHPETLAHGALLAACVAVWLTVRGPRVGRGRFAVRLAVTGALTFFLAAPFLLPILEALPASERAAGLELMPRGNDPPDFEPRFAAYVVDPLVTGSPRDRNWSAPWNFNEQASLYAGLVPLALAVAGALALRGRVLGIVLAGLATLAAGFKIDPFHAAVNALPVLDQGAHGRMRLFWVLAVAVAAGLSLEPLARSRAGRKIFAGTLLAALTVLVWLGTPPVFWQRTWWLATLGGGLALLAMPWVVPWPVGEHARPRRAFAHVALLVLVLDLGLLGVRYNPSVPPEQGIRPPPVLTWLIERHREALAAPEPSPFRVLGEKEALVPNVPALDGLWNVRGNDPARPMAAARFVALRLAGKYFPGGQVRQEAGEYDVAAHRYLGVRYLLTRHRRTWVAAPWQRVYRDQGGRIWEHPETLPLFFFPREVEPVQNAKQALERALEIGDFGRTAVVEGLEPPAAGRPQEGTARIVDLGANRFRLRVAGGGGVLVSSVSDDSGWRVRVGGEAATRLRANSGFLAVRVPPGEHEVVWTYSPDGWRWGLGLFGVGIVGIVGIVVQVRTVRAG